MNQKSDDSHHSHPVFLLELLIKIGPPVFAASTVGCLLSSRFEAIHLVLMGSGLGLMYFGHWREFHRR